MPKIEVAGRESPPKSLACQALGDGFVLIHENIIVVINELVSGNRPINRNRGKRQDQADNCLSRRECMPKPAGLH